MSDTEKTLPMKYTLKIIENVLHFKKYNDRNEVLRVAQAMAKTALATPKYSQQVKDAYLKAFEEIQSLSFNDMQEIIAITSINTKNVVDENNDDN